jgi:lipopolysaccharide/colanic/teichoic acid biosynthesis glycosyltransferase
VVGYLGRPHATAGAAHLGDWSALEGVLAERSVDRLLLASAPPDGRDLGSVVAARLDGISVMSARDFAENLTGEVPEDDLGPEFVTDATSRAYGRVMRLVDVVLAALLLVLLSPLLLGAMLAILATSGRPALFVQDRVGQGGVAYACFKLRTMRPDSEKDGPSWSGRGDPRVTAIGRLLRRWRLDELPQLVNVLRGEMAFVGPRPEQPYFVDRLSRSLPGYGLRHLVRPGITGWAQVRMPYGSSEEDARRKLRCDLFYVKHRSALLDLAILFDTVRVALRGEGR